MSLALPQIWGRHRIANIDGVVIGDKLVTALSDVPEDWEQRLKPLGFKKTVSGWARLGAMAQSEYQYLSPEIELVGFRPEFAIDLEIAPANVPLVPYEVQDALLEMWRSRRQAIDAAITLEHGERISPGRIWTAIEDALAGVESPLTATLYGLSLALLQHRGGVTPEVEAFSDRLEAEARGGRAPVSAGGGSILLAQGATVEWADRDGVVHSSRLARPVRTEDGGFWIYPSQQHWVSGYPVVTPVRIPRSALIFRGDGDAPDWLLELEESSQVPAQERYEREGLPDPNEITLSPRMHDLLVHTLSRREMIGDDWESVLRQLLHYNHDFGEESPAEGIEDAVEWLRRLKAHLAVENEITYGNEPIRFVLTKGDFIGGRFCVGVASCLVIDGQAAGGAVWMANFPQSGSFDVKSICAEAELVRSTREKALRQTSAQLGAVIDAGPAFALKHLFLVESVLFQAAAAYGGTLNEDAFYKVASVQLRDFVALSRLSHQDLSRGFAHQFIGPRSSLVDINLKRVDEKVIPVSELLAALHSGKHTKPTTNWLASVCQPFSRYAVHVGTLDPEWQDLLMDGVLLYKRDWGQTRYAPDCYHATLEGALGKYIETLRAMRPRLPEANRFEVDDLIMLAERFPLQQRLLAVPAKLRAMDDEKLKSLVMADLMRQAQSRLAGWDERTLNNIVGRMIDIARTDQNSGVLLTFKQRFVSFNSVKTTDQTTMESREGAIGKAVAEKKNGRRLSVMGFDSVVWVDPELAALINGDAAPGLLRESQMKDEAGAEGRYEDTGVVAGFALKDIRGFSKDQLISCASSMSDSQKEKYLTKDNLWGRKSFQEMFESKVNVQVAYARDLVWKTMPSKPKSVARDHVQAFIDLLTAFKGVDQHLAGSLRDFEQGVKLAHNQAFSSPESRYAPVVYTYKEMRIKGSVGISLKREEVDFADDWRMGSKIRGVSWTDLIKEKSPKKASASAGSRVQRDALVRTGPDYRNGLSVTGEDFIKTFGFSGVEYGNWTNQAEREKHLNFAYDSMMDFVRVMGWEPMTLSLGGKLGLCIGSRGRGGANAANAHFEPVNMAINLTRMRGDGALAHEFFHAVANHFGRLYRGAPIDLANAIAYPLTKARPELVAPEVTGGIRQQVATTFYNLMASIMRTPAEGESWKDVNKYTAPSVMFKAAQAADKGKREYWAQPAEMFARAMEIWVKDRLGDNKERNDYLVRAGKGGDDNDLYPDAAHLERINHFVADWLESVDAEMKEVQHPFLGAIEMPVLYSGLKSRQPLAPQDLVMLADQELQRLFGASAPAFQIDDLGGAAGLYDLVHDILSLDARHADRGTFYHEVWHAAHAKLLTMPEQKALGRIFSPDGPLADHIANLLEQHGMREAIAAMRQDVREVQAYAFQLWTDGLFDFSGYREEQCFQRAQGFADGALEAVDSFSLDVVESIFRQLSSGALAARKELSASEAQSLEFDAAEWDDDNLYWNPPAAEVSAEGRKEIVLR